MGSEWSRTEDTESRDDDIELAGLSLSVSNGFHPCPMSSSPTPYSSSCPRIARRDDSVSAETEELERVLAITEKEDKNWKEASAEDLDDDDDDSVTASENSRSFRCNEASSDRVRLLRPPLSPLKGNILCTQVEVHSVPEDKKSTKELPLDGHQDVVDQEVIMPSGLNCIQKIGQPSPVRVESQSFVRPPNPSQFQQAFPHITIDKVSSAKNKSGVRDIPDFPSNGNSSCNLDDLSSRTAEMSTTLEADRDQVLGSKIHTIVTQFRTRANRVKLRLERPPTPETNSEDDETTFGPASVARHNKLLRKLVFENFDADLYASQTSLQFRRGFSISTLLLNFQKRLQFIDPRGYANISWLSLQALVFLYNAWVIPLRFFFPSCYTSHNPATWLFFDYLGDFIYLMDILVYKHHLLYMENGFWVKDRQKITRHYVRETTFMFDLLALFPSDLLYFQLGIDYTIVRVTRLFKVFAFWEFIHRLDSVLAKPYFLRIFRTVNYMLYLIHLNACAYYAISAWEGLGSNSFVYNGVGNAYIRCFFFATKTATSIGKNPKPTNIPEIMFMTASWLLGVFVFAILIGDIRDIVGNARKNEIIFQREMDAISAYMNKNKVNRKVQRRIKMWMDYTWTQQKSFDETKVLDFLPIKMKTDIAMRVHYHTLVKVKLFRNCEPGLLKHLVVLLKPIIYLPGDFICRKNDVGKEMFIIQSGQVRVLGGIDNKSILCNLGEGSVFGEIALLGVGGMNKRTADVVSVGFSNLFVLRKEDLEKVLKDYPEAKRILNARARRLMKENAARLQREKEDLLRKRELEKNVLFPIQEKRGSVVKEPALLDTVLKVLPASSPTSKLLGRAIKKNHCISSWSLDRSELGSCGRSTETFRNLLGWQQALSLSQNDLNVCHRRGRSRVFGMTARMFSISSNDDNSSEKVCSKTSSIRTIDADSTEADLSSHHSDYSDRHKSTIL